MPKIYRIKLSEEERLELDQFVSRKKAAAFKVCKARALLLCDEGSLGPSLIDQDVVLRTGIKPRTLERLRMRCHEVGPMKALEAITRTHLPRPPKLDDSQQARLVMIACSEPPEGCVRWTLKLLANELVTLEIVESISPETIRKALKKTISNPG